MHSFNRTFKYKATSTSWIAIACLPQKYYNLLTKGHIRFGILRELGVGSQLVAKCIKTFLAHAKKTLPYSVVGVLEGGNEMTTEGMVCKDLERWGGH